MFERYGWIVTLDSLSDGRPERWDFFLRMNVIEFLNVLTYYCDKREEEQRIMKLESMKRRG